MDDTMKLVGSPPTFSDQNALRILFRASLVSESIHLKCKANGTPPLTYSWLKDGHRLPTRLEVHPFLTSLNWYLRLKELRLTDSGEYTCIVSNPYGSINRTYNLQVISGKHETRPILQSNFPKNVTAKTGAHAHMSCFVLYSATIPDFRWWKWNKSITSLQNIEDSSHTYTPYKVIDSLLYKTILDGRKYGVELRINNVTEDDFGLYTCFVSNHIGYSYNSAFLSRKETLTQSSRIGREENSAVIVAKDRKEGNGREIQSSTLPVVLVPIAFIAVVLGFCYCKELGEKFPEPNMGNIEAETLTLLTSEANPPGQTDIDLRLSSSESFTSKSPLSKRSSRLSASEINTNMKEEVCQTHCNEWEIDRSLLTIREHLGEGAFGLVMRADAVGLPDMPSTCSVAVKMQKGELLSPADATGKVLDDLLSEADTMKKIGKHKNIISLIGACTQNAWYLRATEGYTFSHDKTSKITHTLFVDDLKSYHKNAVKAATIASNLESILEDDGLHWGINKCAAVHVKRGKIVLNEGLPLHSGNQIPVLGEGHYYKFLGKYENATQLEKEVQRDASKEYKIICYMVITTIIHKKSKGNELICNVSISVPHVDSGPIEHLRELDRSTRQIMNDNKAKHKHEFNSLLYLPVGKAGKD
ncbi:PREDICTED: fibroblast growth factor receptor 2-like [Acropora digitifera]|uniref:fibroblast growth factor receptor 2-like n=1 Tax=Acropora digitifera TaxID=70779 RepID=UPI00077AF7F7|nr:PREDICTED: fibroblast growth factor receptor 2-like [Acropora digitifera]